MDSLFTLQPSRIFTSFELKNLKLFPVKSFRDIALDFKYQLFSKMNNEVGQEKTNDIVNIVKTLAFRISDIGYDL